MSLTFLLSVIVGYQTLAVKPNTWYMLAPQFNDVAAENLSTVDIIKVLSMNGVSVQTWANYSLASQIKVLNPSTGIYKTYYYTSGAGGTGWRQNPAAPSTLNVGVGEGVWLYVAAAEDSVSVTMSGQVSELTSNPVSVGSNGEWQIVCNPYPVELTHGKIVTSGITAVPWSQYQNAAQIKVLNPDTGIYTTYYYTSGAGGTQWRANPAAPTATAVICGAGAAFWVKTTTAGTLTFSL